MVLQNDVWTEYISNDEVLNKIETKRTFIYNTRKTQLKFVGNELMRVRKFETHTAYRKRGAEENI